MLLIPSPFRKERAYERYEPVSSDKKVRLRTTASKSTNESEKKITKPERNNIPDSYCREHTRERGFQDEEYPVEALEKRRDCAC